MWILSGPLFEPPNTPLGYNELEVGGVLHNESVQRVQEIAGADLAISQVVLAIKAESLSHHKMQEDMITHTGKIAKPEFVGYTGAAKE